MFDSFISSLLFCCAILCVLVAILIIFILFELSTSATFNKLVLLNFESSSNQIQPYSASIDVSFGDPTPTNKITVGNKVIDLGATFTKGLANPEINKASGDVIYIDNRSLVSRSSRQKEDIKIILEF